MLKSMFMWSVSVRRIRLLARKDKCPSFWISPEQFNKRLVVTHYIPYQQTKSRAYDKISCRFRV